MKNVSAAGCTLAFSFLLLEIRSVKGTRYLLFDNVYDTIKQMTLIITMIIILKIEVILISELY